MQLGDLAQILGDLGEQLARVGVDGVDESDIEFRSMTADELNLGGQAGQRREILQRPTRDDGRRRSCQAGETAECGNALSGSDTMGAIVPS
jgi:hypothetical protein